MSLFHTKAFEIFKFKAKKRGPGATMGELAGLDQKMPEFRQASLDLVPNLSTGYTSPNPAGRPKKNWSKKKIG